MNPDDLKRWLPRAACGAGAIATLAVFAYAALHDRTATSATAGALCLAFTILSVLDLESFEGLGIKAKLRSTLSDAEQRLQKIDEIISALARCSFTQASSGTVDVEEARAMVESLTTSLSSMNFDRSKIDALKAPFYCGMAWYIWAIMEPIYNEYVYRRIKLDIEEDTTKKLGERPNFVEEIEMRRREKWPVHNSNIQFDEFRKYGLKVVEYMNARTEDDKNVFREIVEYLNVIYQKCLIEGNYTKELVELFITSRNSMIPFIEERQRRLSI